MDPSNVHKHGALCFVLCVNCCSVIDLKEDNGGKADRFYTKGQTQRNKRNALHKYRGNHGDVTCLSGRD